MKRDTEETLRNANPITNTEVEAIPLDGAETSLRDSILTAEPGPASLAVSDRPRPRRPRRRGLSIAAAAGVLAIALTAVALIDVGGSDSGPGQAWAAEIIKLADGSPRLVLEREGWRISRADQYSAESGDMAFTNGDRQAELTWTRAGLHRGYMKDRAVGSRVVGNRPVPGAVATVFLYDGTEDGFTALWRSGTHSLEFRNYTGGDRPVSEREFLELLDSLRQVDAETWLTAMPESVIKPSQAFATATEMAADIPPPPGFDLAKKIDPKLARDRYQLGAGVAGAAACGWIEAWVKARANGDNTAAAEAREALGTSRDWDVLREMDSEGDYPEVVWELAAAVARDGKLQMGRTVTVAESYRAGLGC